MQSNDGEPEVFDSTLSKTTYLVPMLTRAVLTVLLLTKRDLALFASGTFPEAVPCLCLQDVLAMVHIHARAEWAVSRA